MQGQLRGPHRPVDRRALAASLPLAVLVSGLAGSGCAPAPAPQRARNVILLIGDGLGMNQLTLGLAYASEVQGRSLRMAELANAGSTGYAVPFSYARVTTDSAAAATQMATGARALTQTLSIDPETAEPLPTILEWAEERGLATGLVSDMRLTHATPAAFAVHAKSRYLPEPEIADQLFGEPQVEVLLGGGGRAMIPAETTLGASVPGLPAGTDGPSNREDDRNLIAEAKERGFTIVGDRAGLQAARGAERLIGLFAASHLPYVLDRSWDGLDDSVPTLAELTGAAIASLEGNEDGFFLMVEGGLIDYAGHENDAGAMLAEILDFDEAVGTAFDFARGREDTLVLVTADHGTGGFSFTYAGGGPGPLPDAVSWDYRGGPEMAGARHLEMLAAQRRSLVGAMPDIASPATAESVIAVIEEATTIRLTEEEAEDLARQLNEETLAPRDFSAFYLDSFLIPVALAARKLANHTQAVWSTGGHTSDPVLLFGYGPGAAGVLGIGENTRVYGIIRSALAAE
ncbi:MAG: alkaline phosphatase [Acidobacteria bacterium]|nr:alkaline phosphatase [Acidobacteriota bacterium]